MHNVAMKNLGTSVENYPPTDFFEFIQLVRDESRFLCNGVKLCREQIPILIEKACEYAEEASNEAKHDFKNRTMSRFKNALPNDFIINDTPDYVLNTVKNVLDTKGHNETSITIFTNTVVKEAQSMKIDIADYSAELPEDCEAKIKCNFLQQELDLIIAHASMADNAVAYWHPVLHDTQKPLPRHAVALLEPKLKKEKETSSEENYNEDDHYQSGYEDGYEFDALYEAQKRVKHCLKFKELIVAPMFGSVNGYALPGPPSHNILMSSVGSFIFSSVWFRIKMKNCAGVL